MVLTRHQYEKLSQAAAASDKKNSGFGVNAPFPPLPTEAGHTIYFLCDEVVKGSKTAMFCLGWKCAQAHFKPGISWKDLERGQVIGFDDPWEAMKFQK